MKKILFPFISFILFGCSTQKVNLLEAPHFERFDQIKQGVTPQKELNSSEKLTLSYLEAKALYLKNDLRAACRNFNQISQNEAFALKQLSQVYALKSCNFSPSELRSLWKKFVPENYIKEAYFTKSLELARKTKQAEHIAEFSFEMVPYTPIKSEKVKLLIEAIEISTKLKRTDLNDKYKSRLFEISPMYVEELTKENIYAVARDFENNRKFPRAQELYLQIINGEFPLEEKIKAYNSYRISFKVARDLKTFLDKTKEMETFLFNLLVQTPDDEKVQEAWVEAKINHARAVWTEHRNSEARQILDEVIQKKIGTQNQLATLYWVYALLHMESKEKTEALKKFTRASEFKADKLDIQENIQWALLWNNFQLKNYKDVIKNAETFTKRSTNLNFIHRLNFWKAKSLQKLNKAEEANRTFQDTFENDNFGFYGLLSSMELELPLSPLAQSEISRESSGDTLLDWLILFEEKKYAENRLKEINAQFRSKSTREQAMSLYALSGWYKGGMAQIFNFPMKERNEYSKKYASILFPTPYLDIFTTYSQKYKVPIELPLSITRQESAFDTNARSWADAFGLMQLIPEKGTELSKKHKIPYKDFNSLYEPKINVEMGTALLADLRKNFNGKFAQSVAGYNASTAAIKVWEKERFNGDYLEFIESIPYEETRNYIKLVFRNYITYKRLLAKEDFIISKKFFEEYFN